MTKKEVQETMPKVKALTDKVINYLYSTKSDYEGLYLTKEEYQLIIRGLSMWGIMMAKGLIEGKYKDKDEKSKPEKIKPEKPVITNNDNIYYVEVLGYCDHDCEAHYRCPVCKGKFGSWQVFHSKSKNRCPKCGIKLRGLE